MPEFAIRVSGLSKSFRLGRRLSYHRFSELIENIGRTAIQLPSQLLRRTEAKTDTSDSNTLWALEDVSFDVPRGEVLGIIGRNGAGKSTLLKLLSRITSPTRGRIEIHGRIGSLLEVGTGFHPELTGRENVFLNGAILGMTQREIRRRFDEIVAFSEVERFLDTAVKHYSSGMQMRLAFAVAAHLEPEILIVDEVLAVGDASFQKKCLSIMKDVAHRGCTCLVVSHNLPVVTNLCDRALLLKGGHIVADGQPDEVIRDYMSSMRTSSGEIRWASPDEAPGNHIARLAAVRIVQDGMEGTSTADVDIATDIVVEIDYWNLIEGKSLYTAIWLKDVNGTFLLSSSNVRGISLVDDPLYGTSYPKGLFRAQCVIPGNFLNNGRYVISAIVGEVPNRTILIEESALSFDVHDTGSMGSEFVDNWNGQLIRPKLRWNTKQHQS